MIRQPLSQKWNISLGAFSLFFLLLCYTFLSYRQHKENPDDTTIPTWSQMAKGTVKIFEVNERSQDRWILEDAKATTLRFFLGLGLGVALAIIFGVHMGCFSCVESVLVPPLSVLAKIPPTAALAVFFVLVGTETKMFVAMVAFGIFPALAISVYLAAKDVPEELLHKSYTIGATHLEVTWSIIFRHILPKIIDAVRLQIGPALVYLIAAEMVCADIGFGYRIRLQSRLLNMHIVYPYLAVLAGFGFFMDYALRFLQKAACPWYKEGKV